MTEKSDNSNNLKGKVINPIDLVENQEGSVVSRTLINKQVGTVTLFSFDKDESLSEHTAPFDAMVYVLEGKVTIRIGESDNVLYEGQMIIMPANVSHALKADEKMKMMLIMIKE